MVNDYTKAFLDTVLLDILFKKKINIFEDIYEISSWKLYCEKMKNDSVEDKYILTKSEWDCFKSIADRYEIKEQFYKELGL